MLLLAGCLAGTWSTERGASSLCRVPNASGSGQSSHIWNRVSCSSLCSWRTNSFWCWTWGNTSQEHVNKCARKVSVMLCFIFCRFLASSYFTCICLSNMSEDYKSTAILFNLSHFSDISMIESAILKQILCHHLFLTVYHIQASTWPHTETEKFIFRR